MVSEPKSAGGVVGRVGNAERMKKAAATRAITSAKLAKLAPENRYAYSKVMACRRALEQLADHIADGGNASGDLLNVVSMVEAQVGQCLFGK